MKTGILTYHCAHNYGAVLQCYALQEYLKSLGHEVYVINYRPRYLKYGPFIWYNWFSLNPIKCSAKIVFQLHTLSIQIKRFKAFKHFINKYLNISKLNLQKEQKEIKCFIFGSDQIWRKTKGKFDSIYFGNFIAAKNCKLISYAASMGLNQLTEEDKKTISQWLNTFNTITVREISLKKILTPILNKNVEVTIDPTFLLNSNEWDKIANIPQHKKPYILIYQVIENKETYKIAQIVAEKLNAEIIEMASNIKKTSTNYHMIYTASPEEFLGWIKNAKFVVTTSFHGTAFSIIYKKAFISIKQNKASDLRIDSLLSCYNLKQRFISASNEWNTEFIKTPDIPDNKLIDNSKQLLKEIF